MKLSQNVRGQPEKNNEIGQNHCIISNLKKSLNFNVQQFSDPDALELELRDSSRTELPVLTSNPVAIPNRLNVKRNSTNAHSSQQKSSFYYYMARKGYKDLNQNRIQNVTPVSHRHNSKITQSVPQIAPFTVFNSPGPVQRLQTQHVYQPLRIVSPFFIFPNFVMF